MNTKPFIELLLSPKNKDKDNIAWISEHIILAVMRYQKQVKGLPKSWIDFEDTSGSFADIYANLQKHSFEAQTIFKEAVYLALQRWSGNDEDDANYLIELIYLASYLSESRVAGYLMTKIHQLQSDHFTQPEYYFEVVNLGFGVIADYASDPNVAEFLKNHLQNPTLSKRYAPFLSWCFIAMCKQDPMNYPLYLNRLVEVATQFPDYYTDFEAELETLSESVSVQTFINQLPKVKDATMQRLYEVDNTSFKKCLTGYFEMTKGITGLNVKGVKRFLDWLNRDESLSQSPFYRVLSNGSELAPPFSTSNLWDGIKIQSANIDLETSFEDLFEMIDLNGAVTLDIDMINNMNKAISPDIIENAIKANQVIPSYQPDTDSKTIQTPSQKRARRTNRGVAYDTEDYDQEIVNYTEEIRLNPQSDLLYYTRGCAYFEKGDYARAIADFDRALQIDPNFKMARDGRKEALRKKRGR